MTHASVQLVLAAIVLYMYPARDLDMPCDMRASADMTRVMTCERFKSGSHVHGLHVCLEHTAELHMQGLRMC